MKNTQYKCKVCNSNLDTFYIQNNVPVNSVIRLPLKRDALEFPKGDIELGFCDKCGFIQNSAFEEHLVTYSSDYNPTQSYSNSFNAFHIDLAKSLIEKYDIKNKTIIEIGCGQGEFLDIITQYANNKAIGFDPACNREDTDSIEFIKDFYSNEYSKIKGDFICSKMTLEHIQDVEAFLDLSKNAIKDEDSLIFFQVPDVSRILKDNAFWDIYYEHCSYFSVESLTTLFNNTGLEVLNFWYGFDKQYLMLIAKPSKETILPKYNGKQLKKEVQTFKKNISHTIFFWNKFLKENSNTLLWGGGSKAVAFLSLIKNNIKYIVDIDPLKRNTYIAGTGQKIVSPIDLQEINPDKIIIMNSVYEAEIKKTLIKHNINAEILLIDNWKKNIEETVLKKDWNKLINSIEEKTNHYPFNKPWGSYTILEENTGYKIKKIEVESGKRISLQKHEYRDEYWIVLKGTATITINNKQFTSYPNESTYIQSGQLHRLGNEELSKLILIEIQIGEYIDENDIIRVEDDFNRA